MTSSRSADAFKKIETVKSGLIEFNDVLDTFKASLKCGEDVVSRIVADTKGIYGRTSDSNEQSDLQEYVKWIKSKGNLKMTSAIVPILQKASLHDVKISSRGPDDKVYDGDMEIRAKIARGNCILETVDSNGKVYYDLIIFALRKFTGGLGDEDDMDRNKNDWTKYFLCDISETQTVISLQKANGEAAHLSCRHINGEFIICSGSKNVHLLFKSQYDIETYYTDARYQVAKQVSLTICKYLDGLKEDLRNLLLSFLCHTKLTVIFEILQPNNQHVEDLSYLSEPLLKFITFTESKIYTSPKTLCAYPPHHALEISKLFEFSNVKCDVLSLKDVDEHIKHVRQDTGYEGVVMYFLDSNMNTVGLLKKKTTWYIIIRAMREKLRSYLSPNRRISVDELKQNICKRLKEIQNWIGFDDQYLSKWTVLATNFADWFASGIISNKLLREDYYTKYPTLWTKYLKEKQLSDHFEMNIISDDLNQKSTKPQKKSYVEPEDEIEDESEEKEENEQNGLEVAEPQQQASAVKTKLSKKEKRKLKKQHIDGDVFDMMGDLSLDN